MTMYHIIADEYDNLFPHPQTKTDFVEFRLREGNKSILDIGCATGELLLSLNKEGRRLTGIDLDEIMIKMAREKAIEQNAQDVDFKIEEMCHALNNMTSQEWDMLLCFGNTLAYLKNPVEMETFLKNAHGVLKPGGQFIIQILNYDNPDIGVGMIFPDLNTDRLRFSRSYAENPKGGILFNTEVYLNDTGEILKDTHQLFPFTSQQIVKAAQEARFSNCTQVGGYKEEEPNEKDFARLYILEK